MNFSRLVYSILFVISMSCLAEPRVIDVEADDPEMLAALSKAKETMPKFWEVHEHPKNGETDFVVKVRIEDNGEIEYLWLIDVSRKGKRVFGKINNEPKFVKNVKNGDRIETTDENIVDWLYWKDGKMVGNYTLRPLLKHMPESEANQYKRFMYEP